RNTWKRRPHIMFPKWESETYPRASIVRYQFPARGNLPPVSLTWFDGRLKPPIPADYINGKKLGSNGTMYVGEKELFCMVHMAQADYALSLNP
ncbi:MAG: hypothetical protein ACOX5R_23100, partial [bacterium]